MISPENRFPLFGFMLWLFLELVAQGGELGEGRIRIEALRALLARLALEGGLAAWSVALAVLPVALPVGPALAAAPLVAIGTLTLRPALASLAALAPVARLRPRLELRAVEAWLAGAVALLAATLIGRAIAWLGAWHTCLALARGLAAARAIVATVVVAVARTLMVETRLTPQQHRLRLLSLGRGFASGGFASFTLTVGSVGA